MWIFFLIFLNLFLTFPPQLVSGLWVERFKGLFARPRAVRWRRGSDDQSCTRLHAELATLDGIPFAQFDAVRMEEELRSYLADWPSLAQRHPAQTRQLLRKLLPSRIRVWREVRGDEKHYHVQGEAAVGRFFRGLVGVKRFGVPNGI